LEIRTLTRVGKKKLSPDTRELLNLLRTDTSREKKNIHEKKLV